jgi:hypothetical protein
VACVFPVLGGVRSRIQGLPSARAKAGGGAPTLDRNTATVYWAMAADEDGTATINAAARA